MKKNKQSIIVIIIILITTAFVAFFPWNNEVKKELTVKDKQKLKEELTNYELEDGNEKIILLSITSKTPVDTLHKILKEYYITDPEERDIHYLDKVIDTISIKHKLSKTKIASLIYQFKFGMQTEDEIIEDGLNYFSQPNSDYDGYSDRY